LARFVALSPLCYNHTETENGIRGKIMLTDYGFVRVAAASPRLAVGSVRHNVDQIIDMLGKAEEAGASVVLFPELSVTGYTCADLFLQPTLQRAAMEGLARVAEASGAAAAIVGLPVEAGGRLFNCAAVAQGGRVLGIVPKINLPNYQEYYERRWFASGAGTSFEISIKGGEAPVPFGADLLFRSKCGQLAFCIEICEDLWVPDPPSGRLCQCGALLVFNPSASDEAVTKQEYRRALISQQSGRCIAGYVYAGAGPDESTTDMVFGGYTAAAENGRMLAEGPRFRPSVTTLADLDIGRLKFLRTRSSTFYADYEWPAVREVPFALNAKAELPLLRAYSPLPFVPSGAERDARSEDIANIQVTALRKRMLHTDLKKAAVNVSGGLDSALTLLVAARLFREEGWDIAGLHALTLPGFGTGGRTKGNALALMRELGCTVHEIDISPAVLQHFKDIGQDPGVHDTAYENCQARERTQILMDLCNRIGALALGTGDLSEAALGWSTYNGDHMSMYNVNCGVPKTLVRHLVKWLGDHSFNTTISAVIEDILATPVTPELVPSQEGSIDQRTEDILGPYELHDFFLYHMLEGGAGPAKLLMLAQNAFGEKYAKTLMKKTLETFISRFFSQQFKRSCVPDGPRVGSVALSPRGDWRMPSDASAAVWLEEVKKL
jgi:NAD+ synthase (glutamine-hydrolysing)